MATSFTHTLLYELVTLFVISDLFVIRTTQAPASSATKLTIRVIGHQWWWEARYPGTTAVTANEILWPAWVGLALAGVVAVSAAVVALPEAWQPDRRPSVTPA